MIDTYGLGAASYNVGNAGASLGLTNGGTYNVYQLLLAANARATGGQVDQGNTSDRAKVSSLFSGINKAG